jgi:acyl transferase domain-containing protein
MLMIVARRPAMWRAHQHDHLLPAGPMLTVIMAGVAGVPDAATVESVAADDGLELAGVNSPNDVTVAGDADAISAFSDDLIDRAVFFRELDLDYAFHTSAMDAIHDKLAEALDGLTPVQATIPFVSAVTGGPLRGEGLDADYWWRNMREPVLFSSAVTTLLDEYGCGTIVEVGPHPVLSGYLRRDSPSSSTRRRWCTSS